MNLLNDPFVTYYSTMMGVALTDLGILADGSDTHEALDFGSPCVIGLCGEHIGMGGGAPHIHGDPYGPTCMYYNNATYYPTTASHLHLLALLMTEVSSMGGISNQHLRATILLLISVEDIITIVLAIITIPK